MSNQSYEKYADEIKNRLIQLSTQDANSITLMNTFYEYVAKNTFINGIKEPYHSRLVHFDLDDIEACLTKCRKVDNHEQQAAFLSFVRHRENKSKQNNFGTAGNFKNTNPLATVRNIKPFNVPGNSFLSQPRPATAPVPPKFMPVNFGNNNFGRNNNKTNQPTPMSVNTRNTNRSGGNQANTINNLQSQNNFKPRTNNVFKSTGPPNFISEELRYQQEQEEEGASH